MNADAAALMHPARYVADRFQVREIGRVKGVGIVDLEKPSEARAAMLRNDQVVALGRAAIAFPLLGPGEAAAAEDRVVGLVGAALVEDLHLMMRFDRDRRPVVGAGSRRLRIVQVQTHTVEGHRWGYRHRRRTRT